MFLFEVADAHSTSYCVRERCNAAHKLRPDHCRVKALGSSADSVDILFYNIAMNDWATGGVLWSDKDAAPGS